MASQTVTTCDKCGVTCEYHYHLVTDYHTNGPLMHVEIDLCPGCFAPLMGSMRDWHKPPHFQPLVAPFRPPSPV